MLQLPSEHEIISNWLGDSDKPLVSIECLAFNHEKFIEDTIKGFLSQKTNFPFEVLIHDDASSDKTSEIIKRYESKYPRIIKGDYQTVNLYSQGIWPDDILAKKYKGEYIAVCEGDDHWCDENKLAQQVNVFLGNPEIELCFHAAHKVNCLNNERSIIGRYRNGSGLVAVEDIIIQKYGQIPTASIMLRREKMLDVKSFVNSLSYQKVSDVYMQILGAIKGNAYYIDSVMSVYHCFSPNSWSSGLLENGHNVLEHVESKIQAYEVINKMTSYKYRHSFNYVNAAWIACVVKCLDLSPEIKISFFEKHAHYLPRYARLFYIALLKFPLLLRLGKKIKRFFSSSLKSIPVKVST